MKIDHRLLLWCVAAWVCCAVVKCRVEFFDSDGKALREENILDKWLLKEDEVKSLEDSYKTKPYQEELEKWSRNEEEGNGDGDGDGDNDNKKEDPDKKEKCDLKCGKEYETKGINCEISEGDALCTCPDVENAKHGFDRVKQICTKCDCGGNFKSCSFADGEEECTCEKDFAIKNKKCIACNCGTNSQSCSFEDDDKIKCVCNTNYAQKGSTCVDEACVEQCGDKEDVICEGTECKCQDQGKSFDKKAKECKPCNCGDKSLSCSFDDGSNIKCVCKPNYLQKGNTCAADEACVKQCGNKEDVTCEGTEDNIECKCQDEGKKYNKNAKECKPCSCGTNSQSCSFEDDGKMKCVCNANYVQKGNACVEQACVQQCGYKEDVTCDGNGDKIVCRCQDPKKRFYRTAKECKPCDCGTNSKNCSFEASKIKCHCEANYAQKGNTCAEEACVKECGDKEDVTCIGTGDNIKCECKEKEKKFDRGSMECRRTCKDDDTCKNGALCEGKPDLKFCDCPTGTKGDTCDDIIECTTGKYAKCRRPRGNCTYDQEKSTAVCICPDKLKLMDMSGYCAKCDCGKNSNDCNFLNDTIKCKCNEGYAEKDFTCAPCVCGENGVSCSFKENKKTCTCKDGFGDKDGSCQKCSCGENVKSCSFEEGKEKCICKEKFALKEGKCEACDCGGNSTDCRFENSKRVCSCKDGFKDDNGTCKECECGKNSTSCEFENGKKICTCSEDNAPKDGKCLHCKCDENTKPCRFEKGQKKCDCLDKFALKDKKCTDCDCGDESTGCEFKGDKKKCSCNKGYGDSDGKCTEDKCIKICGVPPSNHAEIKCEGTRYGDGSDIVCSCFKVNLKFDSESKKCRETCNDKKPCKNGASCEKRDEHSFCDCLENTTGDYCQTITECEKGQKFEKCKGDKGKCKYNVEEQKAECECDEKTLLNMQGEYCEPKCAKNSECSEGKICFEGRCSCEKGKSGDKCEIASGCTDELKNKCKKAGAECTFSKTASNFAACECKDKNLVFIDGKDPKCTAPYCRDVDCNKPATCEFDPGTSTAYCKCPSDKYYNYKTRTCSEPDKCLLRKDPCKENYICQEGKCVCDGKEEGDKCIKEAFCKEGACFPGAKCDNDTATCKCDKDHYFTGSSCQSVKCIKTPFHEDCPCPDDFSRDESKKCVSKGEKCDKDCGLGYCADDSCHCISGVSKLHDSKCVLDKDAVCASQELNEDLKTCKCTGKYKQADDKITCQLVTCAEEKECKNKGAICKMAWTEDSEHSIGYRCDCPTGYVDNKDKGICTDPCSVLDNVLGCAKKDRMCFNNYPGPDKEPFTCDCAPPFITKTKNCDDVADFTYLISGIPVLKKRYQMEKAIDYVKLSDDLMQSLSQMYDKDIFNSGYLHDYVEDGDVLKTSVWVRFNHNISGQLRRFKLQAKSFPNTTCGDDCDTDLYVWPPHVVLKGNDFKDVETKSLSVCAGALKNTLCGKEAQCKDNKCFCDRGYRTLELTIKNIGEKARILRCEETNVADIDECALGEHKCPSNTTTCVNTPGSYICECKPGYWKSTRNDQKGCVDLCTPSPCGKGSCSMKKDKINCKCEAGYGGSYCDEADVNYAGAKKSTVVVGAVLGTILILFVLAAVFFYVKKRKSSYSEDFMPAPRQDHASEMRERRPVRGVVNTSYE